jgi:predicted nucleic acid-binding protein
LKYPFARDLLRRGFRDRSAVLSLRVLREFFAAATRKLALSAEDARWRVQLYSRLEVIAETTEDQLAAIDLHRLHGHAIWDCLILRAALQAGCVVLYSEDLQHGQGIDGLEIVNPFL